MAMACASWGVLVGRSPRSLHSCVRLLSLSRWRADQTESSLVPRSQEQQSVMTENTAANNECPDAPDFNMTSPFEQPRRLCWACRQDVQFNYKNIRLLSQFVSTFTGRVYERRVTGLCRPQQERLEMELKKARYLLYLPKTFKPVEFHRDPELCNINSPVLPHRYC